MNETEKLSRERWEVLSPHLDVAMEMGEEELELWLKSLRSEDPVLAADLEALLEEQGALDREGFLEGAVSLPPPASLAGQRVGAYTLVSSIGQGGMGSVWLARRSDGRFEGRAAVKLLNTSLVGRAGEERFRREGSILARLTHPHIARLVDAGVSTTGQPYLVLEHVEGEQIDCYCDGRGLNVEERVRLFLDVLAAVAHAHANLIVHRDIKPSNVLVATDGQVKLLDFGIAKLLEEEAGAGEATALTREGGRALTPEYAAPEQVMGGAVTTATDVYALGTLLYVLLSGRHPAEGAFRSPADLVKAIVETEPRRLSEVVAGKRTRVGDLDIIVAKALKKRPEERYASVTAFSEDLKRYLNDEPISARRDTLAYRVRKFVRRHGRGVAATAVVVVAVAGLVVFYTARLAAERDRARLESEKSAKVSELMSGLLTGADPYEDRQGKEPTVRGILDAGAERLEKELAGQPELQAEMLTLIGRTYERLGLYDKARPLLEKGLAAGRRAPGGGNERVAQSLNDLGVLLGEKGDSAAATPLLEQALEMRRKLLGRDHKDVAVTLVELGRVYSDMGNDQRAEPLFQESLAIRRKVLGEEDHETAVSEASLATVLWHRGDLAAAERLFRHVLTTFRKSRPPEHPDVATTLNNLALVLRDKGEYVEAEALLRRSLVIGRKSLGEENPGNVAKLNNLGGVLQQQGKYEEAASLLDEALQIAVPAFGEDHPLVATCKISLARVHLARKEAARAEPLLREALRIRRRAYPNGDWRVAVAESLLGETLTALARYGEAEPLLINANTTLKDVPGQQGREASATRDRLAALYEARGHPEKAAVSRAGVR